MVSPTFVPTAINTAAMACAVAVTKVIVTPHLHTYIARSSGLGYWKSTYFRSAQTLGGSATKPAAIQVQRRGMAMSVQKDIDYNVTTEFGTLKSVLVGRADGFRLPAHEHEPLLYERNVHGEYNHVGKPYPADVIQEANDSLDELSRKLKEWNPEIEIIRSDMACENNHTPIAGNRGYSTRDVMVVVKDTLYLCPSLHQSRQTEAEDCFQHVIDDFKSRGKVVDLRTPRWNELCNSSEENLRAKDEAVETQFLADLHEQAKQLDESGLEAAFIRNDEGTPGDERFATITSKDYFRDQLPTENTFEITEEVPIFDAANVLVVNDKQLLYLTSISGNYHGFLHLKKFMKENHDMEVLPMTRVYDGLHIDSTICILNKDKILYCAERIELDQAHNILKNCGYEDKSGYIPVYEEDMHDVGLFAPDQNFASVYIGMNLLAISDDTLVVEEKQTNLIKKLGDHGFNCITVAYPHMRSMGGGVHCTTLPLARDA